MPSLRFQCKLGSFSQSIALIPKNQLNLKLIPLALTIALVIWCKNPKLIQATSNLYILMRHCPPVDWILTWLLFVNLMKFLMTVIYKTSNLMHFFFAILLVARFMPVVTLELTSLWCLSLWRTLDGAERYRKIRCTEDYIYIPAMPHQYYSLACFR